MEAKSQNTRKKERTVKIDLNKVPKNSLNVAILQENVENILQLFQKKSDLLELNAPIYDKITPLMLAASEGKSKALRTLLDLEANPDLKDIHGYTALHYAVQNKQNSCVQILEAYDADVNCATEDGTTPLHLAARVNSEDITMELLDSGRIDIDKKDKKGRTALSYACSYGFEELAAILIGDDDDIKANPKIADVNGRTPLMYAAEFGKVECVSLLVDELSIQDINRSDNNGLTALHLACLNGHKDCVDFLVQSNASITAVDKEGRNAMHAVCLGGHLPCLEFLLSKNSRIVKEMINAADSNGRTPLFYAARYGHRKILRQLIRGGADVNMRDNLGLSVMHWLCYYGHVRSLQIFKNLQPDNWKDSHANTLLHIAAKSGQTKVLNYLLTLGSNLDLQNDAGATPLHLAIAANREDTVKALLQLKNINLTLTDKKHNTPLLLAVKKKAKNSIMVLVKHEALNSFVNYKDSKGRTSVHWSALNGDVESLKLLLESTADLNAKDQMGRTPLHVSCMQGHAEYTALLLSKGAIADLDDVHAQKALHVAAFNGHLECVKHLVTTGAVINCHDKNGLTPLHCCVLNGHRDITVYLIEKGAQVNAVDNMNRTVLHAACHNKKWGQSHADIIKLLLTKGASSSLNSQDWLGNTPLNTCALCRDTDALILLQQQGALLSAHNKKGNTPLHQAALTGLNLAAAKYLLTCDATLLQAKNAAGRTAVHYAACTGNVDMLELFVEKEAEAINSGDNEGIQPIHLAAYNGHKSFIGSLLSEGADIDAKDKQGRSPLQYSIAADRLETSDYIIDKGASPTAVDNKSRTALHTSVYSNNVEIVDLLLDMSFSADAKDKDGNTALLLACRRVKKHPQVKNIIEKLLEKGADVNAVNNRGSSALMLIAASDNSELLNHLLTEGADPTLTDKKHRTALSYAKRHHSQSCITILSKLIKPKPSQQPSKSQSAQRAAQPSQAPKEPTIKPTAATNNAVAAKSSSSETSAVITKPNTSQEPAPTSAPSHTSTAATKANATPEPTTGTAAKANTTQEPIPTSAPSNGGLFSFNKQDAPSAAKSTFNITIPTPNESQTSTELPLPTSSISHPLNTASAHPQHSQLQVKAPQLTQPQLTESQLTESKLRITPAVPTQYRQDIATELKALDSSQSMTRVAAISSGEHVLLLELNSIKEKQVLLDEQISLLRNLIRAKTKQNEAQLETFYLRTNARRTPSATSTHFESLSFNGSRHQQQPWSFKPKVSNYHHQRQQQRYHQKQSSLHLDGLQTLIALLALAFLFQLFMLPISIE